MTEKNLFWEHPVVFFITRMFILAGMMLVFAGFAYSIALYTSKPIFGVDFLSNPTNENRSLVERFLNRIQKFAFIRHLPLELQTKLVNFEVSLEDFAKFLLQKEGMAYGEMPKGLIPFHVLEPFVLNPIQEHIVQANLLRVNHLHFHFTIQRKFEEHFKKTINQIEGLTGANFNVSYSEQNQDTDSYVFDLKGNLYFLK